MIYYTMVLINYYVQDTSRKNGKDKEDYQTPDDLFRPASVKYCAFTVFFGRRIVSQSLARALMFLASKPEL